MKLYCVRTKENNKYHYIASNEEEAKTKFLEEHPNTEIKMCTMVYTDDLTYDSNLTTKEDILNYLGIDLDVELTNQINDIGDEPSPRAINDVELWLIDYCNINFNFTGDRTTLSEYQKLMFKRAVCKQIDYILDNGDLRGISGINQETGMIIDSLILDKRGLSPEALMCLRQCGLANLRRY